MNSWLSDIILGVRSIRFEHPVDIIGTDVDGVGVGKLCRNWLKSFELQNVGILQKMSFPMAKHLSDVTILTYTYPRQEEDFLQIKFSILHTWRMLGGRVRTVIVANKSFDLLDKFVARYADCVSVQYQPALKCGCTRALSLDSIQNFHSRFSTDYCLTIQDDGFPVRCGFLPFLGVADYLGCPLYREMYRPWEWLLEHQRFIRFNGGFSLRTHKICEMAAKAFQQWYDGVKYFPEEDVFYTETARQYDWYNKELKFPTLRQARNFSIADLDGAINIAANGYSPFGFHGASAAVQFIPALKKLGYAIPRLLS